MRVHSVLCQGKENIYKYMYTHMMVDDDEGDVDGGCGNNIIDSEIQQKKRISGWKMETKWLSRVKSIFDKKKNKQIVLPLPTSRLLMNKSIVS